MSELASIAVQIQDRALLLASEIGFRDQGKHEHNQAKLLLHQETKQNSMVRQSLLHILRSRHGYELELTRMQEQQEEEGRRHEESQCEAERWKDLAEEMDTSWKHSVVDIYAQHHAKRQVYQHFLERRIEHRKRQTKMEQDRLEFLERRTFEMQADEKELLVQKGMVEEETRMTDSREEKEDEDVSSLAMQIKATLSHRTLLRRSLQEAKEKYRQANDDMIEWESKCMQQRA